MLTSVNSTTSYTLTLLKEILNMLITQTMVPYAVIDVINLIALITPNVYIHGSIRLYTLKMYNLCQLCFNKAEM